MNIWAFHHYAEPPSGQWTGTFDLLKFLARRGHAVTIFASSFSHYTRTDRYLKKGENHRIEIIDGVRFVYLKGIPYQGNGLKRLLNITHYSWKAWRIAAKDKETPHIVMGTTPHPLCALTAWFVARKSKAKFFFEVHDLWPLFLIEIGAVQSDGFTARILRRLERFLVLRADKILALWPEMHRYFTQEYGISTDKTAWMPIGLDPEGFTKSTSDFKKEDTGCFTVMYRGGMGHSNKLDVIIDAAKLVSEQASGSIRFVLAGEGSERAPLEARAGSLNLNNIIFENFLPKEDSLKELLKADLLVGSLPDLPHFKAYGLVSTKELDYLMAGRPVIYATAIPNTSVVKSGGGWIVPPDDPKAMADAIMKVWRMPLAERARMGKNGLDYILKFHNLRLLAEYYELIGRESLGPFYDEQKTLPVQPKT